MRHVWGGVGYELEIVELGPGDAVERDGYAIEAFPVDHRGGAFGYALVEDDRPGRFDAELAEQLGVAPGPDFGRLQRGEVVERRAARSRSSGEERLGRKLVISGDTAPVRGADRGRARGRRARPRGDVPDEEAERARETRPLHRASRRRRRRARRRCGCSRSCTSRPATAAREIRDEARAIFPDTVVPRDFDTIEVPFPERGEPELVRWSPPGQPARRAAEDPAPDAPG